MWILVFFHQFPSVNGSPTHKIRPCSTSPGPNPTGPRVYIDLLKKAFILCLNLPNKKRDIPNYSDVYIGICTSLYIQMDHRGIRKINTKKDTHTKNNKATETPPKHPSCLRKNPGNPNQFL